LILLLSTRFTVSAVGADVGWGLRNEHGMSPPTLHLIRTSCLALAVVLAGGDGNIRAAAPLAPADVTGFEGAARDRPARGRFLVAARDLLDPNFSRTVVLLVDYDSRGALGVIVNRPTEIQAVEFLPGVAGLRERTDTMWVGGPVAMWKAVLLARSTRPLDGARLVLEDIVFTASREALELLIAEGDEFRLYAGYAAWGPGQLDREIERGGWKILPATANSVFDTSPLELWSRLSSVQWTGLTPGGRPSRRLDRRASRG
jgi:putative transcriptional regulator